MFIFQVNNKKNATQTRWKWVFPYWNARGVVGSLFSCLGAYQNNLAPTGRCQSFSVQYFISGCAGSLQRFINIDCQAERTSGRRGGCQHATFDKWYRTKQQKSIFWIQQSHCMTLSSDRNVATLAECCHMVPRHNMLVVSRCVQLLSECLLSAMLAFSANLPTVGVDLLPPDFVCASEIIARQGRP